MLGNLSSPYSYFGCRSKSLRLVQPWGTSSGGGPSNKTSPLTQVHPKSQDRTSLFTCGQLWNLFELSSRASGSPDLWPVSVPRAVRATILESALNLGLFCFIQYSRLLLAIVLF